MMRAVAFACLLAGCAGGFGTYGPAMTKVSRMNKGWSPNAPGSSWGTYHQRSYQSGGVNGGAEVGARIGVVHATASDAKAATGLATDVHADIVVGATRWSASLTGGYTSDRMFDSVDSFFFSGFPVGLVGAYGWPKIFFHAGVSRVLAASIKNIDSDESTDVSAWRGAAGVTFVLKRSAANDFALRLEGRLTKSSTSMLEGNEVQWSSEGVLGEIVWHTF